MIYDNLPYTFSAEILSFLGAIKMRQIGSSYLFLRYSLDRMRRIGCHGAQK